MNSENKQGGGNRNNRNNHHYKNKKKPYYMKKKPANQGDQAEKPENGALEVEEVEETLAEPVTEVFEADQSDVPEVVISIEGEEDKTPKIAVTGVRFKPGGKVYYFDKGELAPKIGSYVIVETARGPEFGEVAFPNREVCESSLVLPLKPIIRLATDADVEHNKENKQKEEEAFAICQEKIQKHGLDMKLIEAQYAFDNSKLLFYFTSASRVDFRELVKDLASVFRTRIELRQIGIRDEAKLMGGLGTCGRPLCCASFLSDFVQVSIKMAKEQNLSLNSGKISGCCGRLMCCLQYEYSTYAEESAKTPPVDSVVKTKDGVGTVTETNVLSGMIKVRLKDKPDSPPAPYMRDDVTVISKPNKKDDEKDS
jgi:cell fate regulator YaaT (PSP1 superfamily)